jgi:hypothetical protein
LFFVVVELHDGLAVNHTVSVLGDHEGTTSRLLVPDRVLLHRDLVKLHHRSIDVLRDILVDVRNSQVGHGRNVADVRVNALVTEAADLLFTCLARVGLADLCVVHRVDVVQVVVHGSCVDLGLELLLQVDLLRPCVRIELVVHCLVDDWWSLHRSRIVRWRLEVHLRARLWVGRHGLAHEGVPDLPVDVDIELVLDLLFDALEWVDLRRLLGLLAIATLRLREQVCRLVLRAYSRLDIRGHLLDTKGYLAISPAHYSFIAG